LFKNKADKLDAAAETALRCVDDDVEGLPHICGNPSSLIECIIYHLAAFRPMGIRQSNRLMHPRLLKAEKRPPRGSHFER
jgi:hypothetical protein